MRLNQYNFIEKSCNLSQKNLIKLRLVLVHPFLMRLTCMTYIVADFLRGCKGFERYF